VWINLGNFLLLILIAHSVGIILCLPILNLFRKVLALLKMIFRTMIRKS